MGAVQHDCRVAMISSAVAGSAGVASSIIGPVTAGILAVPLCSIMGAFGALNAATISGAIGRWPWLTVTHSLMRRGVIPTGGFIIAIPLHIIFVSVITLFRRHIRRDIRGSSVSFAPMLLIPIVNLERHAHQAIHANRIGRDIPNQFRKFINVGEEEGPHFSFGGFVLVVLVQLVVCFHQLRDSPPQFCDIIFRTAEEIREYRLVPVSGFGIDRTGRWLVLYS